MKVGESVASWRSATDDGVPTDYVVNFDNIHTIPGDALLPRRQTRTRATPAETLRSDHLIVSVGDPYRVEATLIVCSASTGVVTASPNGRC